MPYLQQLENLYFTWKGNLPNRIEPLRHTSASPRLYFRIFGNNNTSIGVFNADVKENRAFFHFSRIFSRASINVPEIYSISSSETYYIIQDLGHSNLLDLLKQNGESDLVNRLYKQSIDQLFLMQFSALDQIDFETFAYPRATFDKQAILWDLYYFKYYFLKVSGIRFDEQRIEQDFQFLAESIANQDWTAFMFRDFQA
ncbi:MAG: aminoglycoside phosphotransferase, partial [Bacteroidales bacterium]|nr:aminoglycoside phosphotransferase [Bacteroidales bacterium]